MTSDFSLLVVYKCVLNECQSSDRQQNGNCCWQNIVFHTESLKLIAEYNVPTTKSIIFNTEERYWLSAYPDVVGHGLLFLQFLSLNHNLLNWNYICSVNNVPDIGW